MKNSTNKQILEKEKRFIVGGVTRVDDKPKTKENFKSMTRQRL